MNTPFRGSGQRSGFRSGPQRLHRLNHEIRVPEVRVVDALGEALGVMKTTEAQAMADQQGVDLVEISPNAAPPVCKIIDYGKMLYGLKKKEQKAKLSNKVRELKGIRLTFKIDVGDLERQRKLAEKFLSEGHPVRVQMKLRGRERAHIPLALEKTKSFLLSLAAFGRIDQAPSVSGPQITAILTPSKS